MPEIEVVKKSLDTIADNPTHPQASAVMQKLGLSENDFNAWKAVKDNPQHPKATAVKNKIFDKIANHLPADPVDSRLSAGPLDLGERFNIKNLLDRDPIAAQKFLETRTDEQGNRKYIARVRDGKLEVRKPDQPNFTDIEREGIDWFDPFDITYDAAKALFEGAAGAAGFIAGAPLGPAASVAAGVGAGTAAGVFTEGLKQTIGKATGLREDFDPGRIIQEGLISGAGTVLGPITKKGVQAGGRFMQRAAPGLVENVGELKEAAKRLGIKPMLRQVYDDDTVHLLEENLQKNLGTIPGAGIRAKAKANQKVLDQIADSMIGKAKNLDPVDVGENARKAIQDKVAERLAPVEEIYTNVTDYLKDATEFIDTDFLLKQADNIQAGNKFAKATPKVISYFKSKVKEIDNLDELKQFRTEIFKDIQEAQAKKDFSEVRVLSEVYDALTRGRSRSLDLMIDNYPQKGSELAQAAKQALAKADKQYATINKELKDALIERGKKAVGSAKRIADGFDEIIETKFAKEMLNTNDPKRIQLFKQEFPEAFEILREGKIAEIAKAATNNKKNTLRIGTIMDRIEKMPRASKELIFGEDAIQKVKDLQVLFQTIPPPLNPSGTSHNLLSATGWGKAIMSNFSSLTDRARLALLTDRAALGRFLENTAEMISDTGAIAIARSYIRNEIPTEAQERSFGLPHDFRLPESQRQLNFGVPTQ